MKKNKDENSKALKKTENKEKFGSKFLKVIKQRWLISGTTTLLLIAILIAAFILINIGVKKLDITALDCTTSKSYTLTDESKERVKNIDKEINIYFVGTDENNVSYELVKQYNKANSNIKVEIVDTKKNIEFTKKYDLTDGEQAIVVASDKTSRKLSSSDLYTYDDSYKTVDLTEQKVTSAILNVAAQEIPKVYFLTGYTTATFENGLTYLDSYLKNEVMTYEELNILSTGKIPEDCDTLVILTPEKDFDNVTTKAIQNYIKNGGKILWLNSAYVESTKLDNVNKILSQYGVNGFDVGYIYENNQKNTVLGYPTCFIPEVQNTSATKQIAEDKGVVFIRGTKINLNKDKFEKLKVEETDLILSSDTTYFTKDLTGKTDTKSDEKGGFTVGAKLEKTIKDGVTSSMIIYGDGDFITDTVLSYDGQGQTIISAQIYNNTDLVLNSIADLTNNDQDITIRRDYSDSQTTFTPTDGEKSVIVKIIFIVPVVIIALGIIVWIVRRNKK